MQIYSKSQKMLLLLYSLNSVLFYSSLSEIIKINTIPEVYPCGGDIYLHVYYTSRNLHVYLYLFFFPRGLIFFFKFQIKNDIREYSWGLLLF